MGKCVLEVNSLLENSSPINDSQFNQLAINTTILPPIPRTTEGKIRSMERTATKDGFRPLRGSDQAKRCGRQYGWNSSGSFRPLAGK